MEYIILAIVYGALGFALGYAKGSADVMNVWEKTTREIDAWAQRHDIMKAHYKGTSAADQKCENCGGVGFVDEGEFDSFEVRRCYCNPGTEREGGRNEVE